MLYTTIRSQIARMIEQNGGVVVMAFRAVVADMLDDGYADPTGKWKRVREALIEIYPPDGPVRNDKLHTIARGCDYDEAFGRNQQESPDA